MAGHICTLARRPKGRLVCGLGVGRVLRRQSLGVGGRRLVGVFGLAKSVSLSIQNQLQKCDLILSLALIQLVK